KNQAIKDAEDKLKLKDDELKLTNDRLAQAKLDFAKELTNKDTNTGNELKAKNDKINELTETLKTWGNKPLTELDNQKKDLIAAHKDIGDLKKKLDEAIKTSKRNQDELAAVRATAEEIDITKIAPESLATIVSV